MRIAAISVLVAVVSACSSVPKSGPETAPAKDDRIIVELVNDNLARAQVGLSFTERNSFTGSKVLGDVGGKQTRVIRVDPVVFGTRNFTVCVRLDNPAGAGIKPEGCAVDRVMTRFPYPGQRVVIRIPDRLEHLMAPVVFVR